VLVDVHRVDGETSPSVPKHVRVRKTETVEEVEQAEFMREAEIELPEEK